MLNISKIVKNYLLKLKQKYPKITIEQVIESNEKLKKGIEPKKSYASRLTADQINELFAKAYDKVKNQEKEKSNNLTKRIENLMTKVNSSIKNENKNKEKSIANINRLYGKALRIIENEKKE